MHQGIVNKIQKIGDRITQREDRIEKRWNQSKYQNIYHDEITCSLSQFKGKHALSQWVIQTQKDEIKSITKQRNKSSLALMTEQSVLMESAHI